MLLELVAGRLLASLLRRPGLCPKTCLFLACLRALAASSPGFRGPELPSLLGDGSWDGCLPDQFHVRGNRPAGFLCQFHCLGAFA